MKIKNNTKHHNIYLESGVFLMVQLILIFISYNMFSVLLKDTKKINQTSDLGMLSQQLTKAAFTLQAEVKSNLQTQTSLAQLNESSNNFDLILKEIILDNTLESRVFDFTNDLANISNKTNKISREWQSWNADLEPILKSNVPNVESIDYAVSKLSAKNVYLLTLTDDLSVAIKSHAAHTVELINKIQILAAIFFACSLFWFVNRYIKKSNLNLEDKLFNEKVIEATGETVLLLNKNSTIIKNKAYHLNRFFLEQDISDDFVKLFSPHLKPSQLKELSNYINVLFNPSADIQALQRLNPLQSVQIQVQGQLKYISVSFTQIVHDDEIYCVYVKITDLEKHLTSLSQISRLSLQ